MKGISLAIETIIILILAVTVLSVLLFFFRENVNPAQDTVKYMQMQTNACSGYVSYNPRCVNEELLDNTARTELDSTEIKARIGEACKALNKIRGNYPACSGGSGDMTCIRQCCKTFCPL